MIGVVSMLVDALVIRKGKLRKGDSNVKSLLKTVSWRIVGTIDTMIIAYILTGEIGIAFSIGSVELFTKMVLYYVHERIWNRIA